MQDNYIEKYGYIYGIEYNANMEPKRAVIIESEIAAKKWKLNRVRGGGIHELKTQEEAEKILDESLILNAKKFKPRTDGEPNIEVRIYTNNHNANIACNTNCKYYVSGVQKRGENQRKWERCNILKRLYCAEGACNWFAPQESGE